MLGYLARDGILTASIQTQVLTRKETASFNGMVAAWAGELILGPTKDSVGAATVHLPTHPIEREFLMEWPVDPAVLRAHELEWHRLTSHVGLRQVQATSRGFQDIDIDALGNDMSWVVFPPNIPELRSGLSMRGGAVMLSLNARWGREEARRWAQFRQ